MRRHALAVLAAACLANTAHAQGAPRVFIGKFDVSAPASDTEAGYKAHLVANDAAGWLMYMHSCADAITHDDVAALISFDRDRQLLGYQGSSVLEEVAAAVGARYYVSGKVIRATASGHDISLTFWDTRRSRVLGKAALRSPLGQMPDLSAQEWKQLFKELPECDLELEIDQNWRSTGKNRAVGAVGGVIPLEINGNNDVEGEGEFSGVLVPLVDSDKVAREASIDLDSWIKVEGKRIEEKTAGSTWPTAKLKLTVRSTASSLSAGGQTFGGRGSGSFEVVIPARVGAREIDTSLKFGEFDVINHLRIRRRSPN